MQRMDNAGLLTTIMKHIPFLGVKKMAHTVHCASIVWIINYDIEYAS